MLPRMPFLQARSPNACSTTRYLVLLLVKRGGRGLPLCHSEEAGAQKKTQSFLWSTAELNIELLSVVLKSTRGSP